MQQNDQKTTSENSLAFADTNAQQHQDTESSVLAEIEAQVLDDVRGEASLRGAGLSNLKGSIKRKEGHFAEDTKGCPIFCDL
jgi:hypothetical protein